MTVVNYINLSMEVWGCIMCGVVMLCLMLGSRPRDESDGLYLNMLLCNIGALLFDALALLFRGHPGALCWWGVRLSNLLAFSSNYGLLASFNHYLTVYLGHRTTVSRKTLFITRLVCGTGVLLVLLTQFFPIFYTIDAQNVYHRASFFWLSHLVALVCIALNAGMLTSYRKYLSAQERAVFGSYLVLPVVAICVQIFIYGLVLVNLADTITMITIFVFLQAEQARQAAEQKQRFAEQENLLTQSRVSIMLSQIQPHFLYNALLVIQNMCHGKAPEAEEATIQFSEFLRGNLDSLQADKPISFAQELRHTQNYLWLEQQRFGSRLSVAYDIQTSEFRIPALTLQPIVENAVRYGVMKKECGGTVRISASDTADAYLVTVEDDGSGFDPFAPKEDGRTHIGISNVRDRLRAMCGGSLCITSTPGRGTVVTIEIPKGSEAPK